ncbi:hypothetical protein XH90_21755 [Bradyrhizobium sp. CCBAU 53338]|nr:hypothetical protein XH90_21755 [Bradyrhizobium sp. CCBAU 53338]
MSDRWIEPVEASLQTGSGLYATVTFRTMQIHGLRRSDSMRCCADVRDTNQRCLTEQERIGERFLEQFALLEDGLAHLQLQMRRMSESAKQFGSLARQMRQATYPADCGKQDMTIRFEHRGGRSVKGE